MTKPNTYSPAPIAALALSYAQGHDKLEATNSKTLEALAAALESSDVLGFSSESQVFFRLKDDSGTVDVSETYMAICLYKGPVTEPFLTIVVDDGILANADIDLGMVQVVFDDLPRIQLAGVVALSFDLEELIEVAGEDLAYLLTRAEFDRRKQISLRLSEEYQKAPSDETETRRLWGLRYMLEIEDRMGQAASQPGIAALFPPNAEWSSNDAGETPYEPQFFQG